MDEPNEPQAEPPVAAVSPPPIVVSEAEQQAAAKRRSSARKAAATCKAKAAKRAAVTEPVAADEPPAPASEMLLSSIAPWFGGKRTMAPEIVKQLGKHSYYFEGCCGSMAVLLAKELSSHETVCDMHGALTNLAWCVQRDEVAVLLYDRLSRVLYSDQVYQDSKDWMAQFEANGEAPTVWEELEPDLAYHYFIASWMGRNGVAGTERVNYQLATRWTKGGGSGPLRFRNAVESIPAWHQRLRNVCILRRDLFELLAKVADDKAAAIYVDPPYLPSTMSGQQRYLHDFGAADHARLAEALRRFQHARVVVSYYADPQLADLYPGWTQLDCSRHKHLHVAAERGSKRSEAPEVLVVNGQVLE